MSVKLQECNMGVYKFINSVLGTGRRVVYIRELLREFTPQHIRNFHESVLTERFFDDVDYGKPSSEQMMNPAWMADNCDSLLKLHDGSLLYYFCRK